jgi:squalene cyclase
MPPDARQLLLARQNPDGGWGYYAGQSSWLEPTAYAALALHGTPASDRAMAWLGSCQMPSGGWPASPQAQTESWAGALVVLLKCVRGECDASWEKGVQWLLRTRARQVPVSNWMDRLLRREPAVVLDPALEGWPWTPGTAGWIEPTVHAVRALEWSRKRRDGEAVRQRIETGIRMILDRQCRDGGWNYGNKRVLGEDLESFPECTGLALVGLCGRGGPQVEHGIRCALGHWRRRPRGLAQAVLRVAFRMQGVEFDDRPVEVSERTETTVLALARIGDAEGAWKLWKGDAA